MLYIVFYFHTPRNICPKIFLFLDSIIYYTLIIKKIPKAIWCVICFALDIANVVNCRRIWKCGTYASWVAVIHVLPHMVWTSVFLFLIQEKILIWGNLQYTDFIHICLLKRTKFSLLRVNLFVTCRPPDTGPLLFAYFNSDYLSHLKYIFLSSYHWVLYLLLSRRVFLPCLQYGKCGTYAFWVAVIHVLPHMVWTSVFFFLIQEKILIWGNLQYTDFIHICLLKRTKFSLLRVNLFVTCRPPDTGPLLFAYFNSDYLSHLKYIFLSSYHWVLYLLLSRRVFLPCLQYEALFF